MTRAPLAGAAFEVAASTVAETSAATAAWLLTRLGGRVTRRSLHDQDPAVVIMSSNSSTSTAAGAARATLTHRGYGDVDGIPSGTLDYASGIAAAAAALVSTLADTETEVDGREVAVQVLLPLVMAASYAGAHREPRPPRPVGDGAVAADLASDDDEQTLLRMLASLGDRADDPVAVADEAQLWRLPVCAFADPAAAAAELRDIAGMTVATRSAGDAARRRPEQSNSPTRGRAPAPASPPLAGVRVCDFTAMWSGPLCTWLLAGLGAEVSKVEPAVRLDGLRGRDGRGIHPVRVDASTGDASGMFNALNRGKQRLDLDLRRADDEHRLRSELARSDVVIDNFSRRVMPNLGLGPTRLPAGPPGRATISMPAFPAAHRWQVALGPGIHAALGLGTLGGRRFASPAVAYPDPLGGLTAFAEVLASLVAARHGRVPGHAEVTLYGATAPLAACGAADSSRVAARDRTLGERLLDDPALTDAWEWVTDGAGRHRYPRSPVRGAWEPVVTDSAPSLLRPVGGSA